MRGDRRGALDWLDRAVTSGYDHWEHMRKDSDLKPLHGTPEFEALVARAKASAPAR